MAEFYMMAAAGRYFKEVRKLVDAQIDQALVYVQTGDIHKPAFYDTTCLTLGRHIETAIAMNAVPSPSHLPKLLLIVKEVYIRKAGLPDSSLMTLLIHIKSACQAGWYTDEDKDCLLIMVDKATLGYYNLDNPNDEPTDAHSVSEVISRFYPRMRVEQILVLFDVKAGEGKSVADFYIAPNTLPYQNLWLLVARTDNMETSACLTSPSNVDEVPNRTRKQMGKGPQLPTNVTKMVKDGVNHLEVIGKFDGEYVIALVIMSLILSPDSSRLQDYIHPMSNNVESDCFVTEGPSRILLDCPISGRRIRTPVKGHLCKHSQCFDYDYFMEANFMRPLWKCPVAHCKQPICNLDIRIDQAFLKILNEVAEDVGDVYVSDDGSWTVSLTEKSQINRDAINKQNHVNLVSLETNETPTMSSLALHTLGSSAISMPVECPSTTTVEQPRATTSAVSLEANETPPMSSFPLHNIGVSVIEGPSTFEQPTVTMPAISLESSETPPMSSAFHNTGGSVIECSSTFEQLNVTTPPVFSEANGTPPTSSAFQSTGGPAINMTMEGPSTFEQASVTTPTVDPPQVANESHLMAQSSCKMVHTPPPTQETRPNPNPTVGQPTQTQQQNSQTQTDQHTEADNGTCTGNQARSSNRARQKTVFTPVLLTPPSAAPVLRKLERRPRSTTDEAQRTTLVTPPIQKRGRKRKITTVPAVGTEAQGTTLVTPVIKKKRGRKPKIPTDQVTRDEMYSVGMRGMLTGKEREAALLKYLAPPIQPIHADKPWPEPTTTVPVELLMKEGNINHPRDLPQ